jgi:hypothetical protein
VTTADQVETGSVDGVRGDVQNTTESSVPRAFAYYRLIDRPHGQATRRQFEQLAKSRLDLPEQTIRQVGVAMNTGDRLGDT